MPQEPCACLWNYPHCSDVTAVLKAVLVSTFTFTEWKQRMEPIRAYTIAELVAALMLSARVARGGGAGAKKHPGRPAEGAMKTTPKERVVTAAGPVTTNQAGAVVVRANLPAGGVGQTKAGDLVYKGDVVQTGA